MRVLVTRPEPAARRTAECLRERGYEPVLLPLSRAIHQPAEALAALEKPFDALIGTSAEAFRALGSLPEGITRRRIFCVGPATAQAAAEAGFSQIVTAQGTGISLAALIREAYAAPPALPLLYFAGEPRSPDLEEGLKAAGFPLITAVCYHMETLGEDGPLQTGSVPDIILLYSRENALRFFALPAVKAAPQRFGQALFLCMSEKTADAVPPAFRARARVAAAPDEESLLALLPSPSSQI